MLDADAKAQLKTYLERLVQLIELVTNVDDSEDSRDMMDLLHDVTEQSSMVVLTEQRDAVERTPLFLIHRTGADVSVRFAAIPADHEFTSLVPALLQVDDYTPKFEAGAVEQIRNIEGDFRFETYMSLTYQNCPDVVQALNVMSVINPRIQHAAVDGTLFQGEIEARQVMAVSTVFLSGGTFGTGRVGVKEILAKVDTGAAARDAEKLTAKEAFDVLIIDGGPTNVAAAVYAACKGTYIGVVTERSGGQALDTLGTEDFISVQETEGPKFAATLEQHVRQYGVDIMSIQRAVKLTSADKSGGFTGVTLVNGAVLKGRLVILSAGVCWRNISVPGEQGYKNKGMAYCLHRDGPLFKGKRMAIIDGDNSGMEAVISLTDLVSHVTLSGLASELKADAMLVHELQNLPDVATVTSAQATEIAGDGQKINGLRYKSRVDGAEHTVTLEGVFVQIGLVPNTEWLDGVLGHNRFGEIVADTRGQTSAEGVFAVGDMTTAPYGQIIIATGDDAKAALSAFDHLIRVSLVEVT